MIASDDSFQTKIEHLKTTKKEILEKAAAEESKRGVDLPPEKRAILQDIKRRFKRMQTTDFQKKDPLNETSQSTFFGG